jgi:membrane protease YdiL (CAAX protease family)
MKKSLSIASANLLYLVTMLLVIVVGSIVQTLHLSWGLIATEVVLIALPAILFLRGRKIPLKEGLRLNRISLPVAVVSLLLGVSTYLFSVLIELVMAKLTGLPSVDLSQSAMPQSTFQYALYFVAIAISAPICEELLFRGAIQSSYEQRKSAVFAIAVPALMFAFYHFRLSGLPGLLPVAFLIGYVAWRSRSTYSTMLVHFGMNASAATITILALSGNQFPNTLFSNYWILGGGLAVTLVLLFIFIRLQPKPEAYEAVEEAPASWFKKYWALVVAGILYAVVVGLTLYAQLSGATASTTLTYTQPEITAPVASRYQAVNRAGDVVGGMDCVITPQGDNFNLACDSEIEAFEVVIDNSTWIDEGHAAKLAVTWSSAFELLGYSYEMTSSSGGAYNVKIGEDGLTVTNPAEETTTDLPETYLTDYEWAWRLYNLDGSGGLFYKTPYVYPSRWDNEANKNTALIQDEVIHVAGDEALSLPAGEFKTVKITLGSQTVWYDVTDTSAIYPVQFDDGMLVYSLMK